MKVAITGHTRGIGKEISNYFESKGAEVVGFSKSTGFDIEDSSIRNSIVEASRGCDIFVNNAFTHNSSSQLEMLKSMKKSWEGTNKLIINVSSRAGDSVGDPAFPWPVYAKLKHEQDLFCQIPSKAPWILNLKPGTIDTDMTKDQRVPKMDVSSVSKILHFILENRADFKIKTVSFTI